MPQGDKSSCTDKLKRKAEHIEGYEDRGVGRKKGWETRRKRGNA